MVMGEDCCSRGCEFESQHGTLVGHINYLICCKFFIRTKWSERAKRAHSVLREVEKMGYKNFPPYPYRVVG